MKPLPADEAEVAALFGPMALPLVRDDAIIYDRDGWYRTLTPSSSTLNANEVLFSNLGPDDIEGQIDEVLAWYRAHGRPTRWSVYPWTRPADLGERLMRRGARPSLTHAFSLSVDHPLADTPGATVEPVYFGAPNYEPFMALLEQGWHLADDEVAFRRHRYRLIATGPQGPLLLFLTRYRGEIAGVSTLILHSGVGYVGEDYILPEFRGHGLFTAATAARMRAAAALGVRFLSGHTLLESTTPIVTRYGMRLHHAYTMYDFDAAPATPGL